LEIFFGVYGIMAIFISIFSNNPIFVPIIGLQTVGFFYIAYMSLSHTRFQRNKSSDNHVMTKNEKMAKLVYKLSMVGMVGIIVFGGFMAITGYNTDIYPLDRMRGHLDGIIGSSDPVAIRAHLVAIQEDLNIVMENPNLLEATNANGEVISKNPVWMFPTDSTNFLRIQNDVNFMLTGVEKISTVPKDSSAFHTGMIDVSDRATQLRINVMDATPYMYVSAPNVLYSVIWIVAIMAIFTALKRKKEQLKEADELGV
jgi:hypothetical protein